MEQVSRIELTDVEQANIRHLNVEIGRRQAEIDALALGLKVALNTIIGRAAPGSKASFRLAGDMTALEAATDGVVSE